MQNKGHYADDQIMIDSLLEAGYKIQEFNGPVWRELVYRPTVNLPLCSFHEFEDKYKNGFLVLNFMCDIDYQAVLSAVAGLAAALAWLARATILLVGGTGEIYSKSYISLGSLE